MHDLLFILIITTIGPIIGSFLGIIRKPSAKVMMAMLAFAGGVMLAISFLNLIPESLKMAGVYMTVFGVFSGCVFMYILDIFIPHIHPAMCSQEPGKSLQTVPIYLLLGIFMHNIPEGISVAIGAMSGFKLSFSVAIAIAIHNIPEGICTSAPLFSTGKGRLQSFLMSSATAIPLIAGFLIGYAAFDYISGPGLAFLISATAGVMIYISADELIPVSCSEHSHSTIFALVAGIMLVLMML